MKKHQVRFRKLIYALKRLKDAMYCLATGRILPAAITLIFYLGICLSVCAQDGIAGIQEANNKVRSYFQVGTSLMYAIGAILGLIGAIKVYQKWSNGHQDTGSVAAAWFGSCVFLVVAATVLKSFFGV